MANPATVLALIFLLVICLRSYSLLRSIIWIQQHGSEFARFLWTHDQPKADKAEREQQYLASNGTFFPFGIKGVRISGWAENANQKLSRYSLKLLKVLWNYVGFCILAGLILSSIALYKPQLPTIAVTIFILSGNLLIANLLLISTEAVMSVLKTGAWGRGYHGSGKSRDDTTGEFHALFGAAFTFFVSTASTLLFLFRFRPEDFLPPPPSGIPSLIFEIGYHSLGALVSEVNLGAISKVARSTELVVTYGRYFIFGIVFSIIASSSRWSDKPEKTDPLLPNDGISISKSEPAQAIEQVSERTAIPTLRAGPSAIKSLAVVSVIAIVATRVLKRCTKR